MKLSSLLKYKKITIQCHDNPDADAIASGYALYRYFEDQGVDVRLVYSGYNRIQKANLIYMVDLLKIPIEKLDERDERIEGLLLTVDCQYGCSNVTKYMADQVAVIDHHINKSENIELCHIKSDLGSCATVVWLMLLKENYDFSKDIRLQTALYYGLYTDTGQFVDIVNPVDKDMRDGLTFDVNIIKVLQNSNINARELEVAGIALIRASINEQLKFAVVKSQPCDPNILGLISDLVLQVSEIDKCIVFCEFSDGLKFSVRTCVKENNASHVAQFISEGIGSGGGHINKAGGFISFDKYNERYREYDYIAFFAHQLKKYSLAFDLIHSGSYEFDCEGAKEYRKLPLKVGYIEISKIISAGTKILIRTLEGDIHYEVNDDSYLMIGVKGEVYPISKSQFDKGYRVSDEEYDLKLQYHPKAKVNDSKNEYSLLDYVKVCYSNGGGLIYAKALEKPVKVFTKWDQDSYTVGRVGDMLACRKDDLNDVYIIEKETFEMTYEEV